MDLLTAPADTAEAVAALVPDVRAGDVTHVHVRRNDTLDGIESDTARMERVYMAGHAAIADVDLCDTGYSYWSSTEHYGHGISWQWIHLCDGRRIALTWID